MVPKVIYEDPDNQDVYLDGLVQATGELGRFFAAEEGHVFSSVNPDGGNFILTRGVSKNWNGTTSGINVYKDFESAMDFFNGCVVDRIWDKDGQLFISGSHHDGGVQIELRQLTDAGQRLFDEYNTEEGFFLPENSIRAMGNTYREGDENRFIHNLFEDSEMCALPRYMERCFGVPHEKVHKENVRDWYRATFPGDDLGERINPDLTFEDLTEAVSLGDGFYDVVVVGDSVVRERLFDEIARRESVAYEQVYDAWINMRSINAESLQPIRAVLIPIVEFPYEVTINPEDGSYLHGLQTQVGGLIDIFDPLSEDFDGADLVINDEGLFECPPNRAIYATEKMADAEYLSQLDYKTVVKPDDLYTVIHGPMLAVGYDSETGREVSLTDSQAEKVIRYFTEVSPPMSGLYEEVYIRGFITEDRRDREIQDWRDFGKKAANGGEAVVRDLEAALEVTTPSAAEVMGKATEALNRADHTPTQNVSKSMRKGR